MPPLPLPPPDSPLAARKKEKTEDPCLARLPTDSAAAASPLPTPQPSPAPHARAPPGLKKGSPSGIGLFSADAAPPNPRPAATQEWDVAWKSSLATEEESALPLPSHDPSNNDGSSDNDWAHQHPSPVRRRSLPPLRRHRCLPLARQGARASLPLIRLVFSSVLLCCQILRSCRTSISLPPWEERHQAIAATKAAETTTSLRGSEVSVFLQSKTCVERRL